MDLLTFDSALSTRFRVWLVAATSLLTSAAQAAVPTTAYSTANVYSASSTCGNPVLCLAIGEGVENASLAANNILTDYATIYKGLSANSTVSLKLGLNTGGQIGDRAGIVVAPGGSLLSLSALGTYTLVTYKNGTSMERRTVSADVVQSLKLASGNSRPTRLEFVAGTQFDAVELVITGAVSAIYSLNVYYAYSVSALQQQPVRGLVSRFGAGNLVPYYSTASTPIDPLISVCGNSNVTNPEFAVDNDLTNRARFGSFISVNCPTSLSVKLENLKTAPAGTMPASCWAAPGCSIWGYSPNCASRRTK